jgi:hypothetical protein
VLTLQAKDTVTPVAVTRFKVDDGEWQEYTGDGDGRGNVLARGVPLSFEETGEHRVRFYSIDAAGNKENDVEQVIRFEAPPPTPKIVPGGQLNFGLTEVQKVVTLTVDGPGILRWKATPAAEGDWLSIEPAEGVIKGQEQQKLTVKIDRAKIKPGDFLGSIVIGSQVGQTDVSATIEVIGKQTVPPTPVPQPTPAVAQKEQGGRGAGTGKEEPVAEPAELTIQAPQLEGKFLVHEKLNVTIEWYVAEAPAWVLLDANGQPLDINQRIVTEANTQTTVTVSPDWNQVPPGGSLDGEIVIHDSSNRYTATVKVTVKR